MNIVNILEIASGVLVAKLIIGVLNESYRFKWQRVRMELKRVQRTRQRQKEKIKVSCKSEECAERNVPLVQSFGGSKTSGKHRRSSKRGALLRFFDSSN